MLELIFVGLMQAATGDPQVTEAAPTEQVQEEAQSTPSDESQRVRCRTEPRPNSRFGQRVCLTGEQWNERREAARRMMQETQNAPRINASPPGGG